MADKPKKESVTLSAAKLRYAEFIKHNPTVRFFEFGKGAKRRLGIVDLWDDPSIGLIVPEDDEALLAALSSVYCPPRYTALHHRADKRLEVIWTAFKLDKDQQEIKGREFSFRLSGKTYNCKFGPSSSALLEIAKYHIPLRGTETNFRNLRSFKSYGEGRQQKDIDAYDEPLSFWIDGINWDDNNVLKLVRHINFYLQYYDSLSPVIEIHPTKSNETINPKARYVGDSFPKKIVSRELEANLLVFYSASFDSNTASNFLNLYRIIEFVSYGHMHDTLRKQVRAILNKPSALDDVERSSTEIILLLREAKLEREQETIVRLLVDVIDPPRLWREVCENKAIFTKPVKFEGDLELGALISDKDTIETFAPKGVENFARAITQLRNGLAHGKDSKSAKSVLPTSRNFELLRPWMHLIALAAGEVVLHDGGH